MARNPRKYAVPLVVTFAAMSPACSGKITGPEVEGSGGMKSDGDLGSGGGAGSNPPGWGDTGGSDTGGSGGLIDTGCGPGVSCNPPEVEPCDLDELVWAAGCPFLPECFVEVDCTGGESRQFFMSCHEEDGFYEWRAQDSDCSQPAEECSHSSNDAIRFRCDTSSWWFWMADQNLNPPAPCPLEKPVEGAECVGGDGFGSDPTMCAYPCENGDDWTLMGCGSTEWESDGACSLGIGGSAGGAPE